MAAAGEEMADFAYGVLARIKAGHAVTKADMYRATTFFEGVGERLAQEGQAGPATHFYQVALSICTENVKIYGHNEVGIKKASDLTNRIGVCYHVLQAWDEAIFHFDLAYRTDPDNVRAAYNLARLMLDVFAVQEAIAVMENVLRRQPKTSMHEEFEKMYNEIMAARALIRQHLGLDEDGLQRGPTPAVMGVDRGLHDSPRLQENEGACASLAEVEGATAAEPRRQARRKARSRSRSTSESNRQRNTFPSAMPPKLSKKDQARLDRMRLKDIEMNTQRDIAEKKRKQEKEEAKRIRRESEGDKPSQFDLAPDLRHVVPGGMQKTKAEARQERSMVKQSSPRQAEEQAGGKSKEMPAKKKSEEKKEVKLPKISQSFDRKFALAMACSDCYVITGYGRRGFQYKPDLRHACEHSILMVAKKSILPHVWVKVRPRPRMDQMKSDRQFNGDFRMCEQYPACAPCTLGEARCTFCHNEEEREIWQMDMRDANFTLGTLIAQQKKWAIDNDSNAKLKPKVSGHNQGHVPTLNGHHQNMLEIECPFQLEKVCGSCWHLFGSIVKQKGNNCNTTGVQHKWDSHSAYLLKPENELIRTFADTRRDVCRHYTSRGSCSYGNACNFIHGLAEHKVYKWMVSNGITSLDQLVALSKAKTTSKQTNNHQKQKVTASSTALDGDGSGATSSSTSKPSWFCKVCNEDFTTQLAYDKHCTSRQHDKNLLTDKDRPWHYRPPPWGGDYPRLCNGVANSTCQYAGVPDMYNQCSFAHSNMELDEWKERTNYFRFKKSIMSNPNGVFSYVHSLQDEFERVKLESDMMMQDVEGVQMEFSPQATIFFNKKDAVQSWTFTISSEKELQKVSLLLNESRLHFNLATDKRAEYCPSNQVEDGAAFLTHTDDKRHYSIKVNFRAGLFGSFRQKVIFDFGTRPLLSVTLDVEVGNEFVRDEILKLRKELPVERWTSKTHTVVPFSASTSVDQEEESLLCKYKPPDTTVFSQDSMVGQLNHNNYVHMMHNLVRMEELERTHIASRFNVVADVQLTEAIPGKEIHAPVGHLFARVPLTDQQLSEDSDTGYLMLSGSVTAWVGPAEADPSQATPVVYEAEVVSETNFGFDGRGKDYFYLCLSKRTCTSLKLKSGSICSLAVQLQIDRLPFCRMHYGLDQLPDTTIVFPDLSRYDKSPTKSKCPKVKSDFLNDTQLEILQHMMKTGEAYMPPLAIYGPFGSGKTETLARATEEIVKTMPNSRILICALNDSAADLYISRHFRNSVHLKQQEILRVYSPARRKDTISEHLHPYCQKTVKGQFRLPDKEAIDDHRIIVTTLATSLMLTDQNMRGRFTHILLDEAGQCLECEAILPLTLATNSTCVVLAGDHLQLGPKSFSSAITHNRIKLNMSILERLVLYYFNFDKKHQGRLVKLLNVNYRSHPKVMSFISEHFYSGAIECRSDWGQYSDFKPLAFYATCGKENTDGESTSYYNISEIQEIVEQISQLYDNWPSSWGERSPARIAVLTPYSQQVKRVKSALTRCKDCFKDIRVSKVSDVQGEEFHAIFLTTVRTHHAIENSSNEETFGFCSNIRLVNTAMTRAKCQVVVVGDPSSLTSFGNCGNIWRKYLDWCSEDGCLYPHTFTLGEIRLQVGSLQKKRDMENPSISVYSVPEEVFDVADMEADEIIQQLKMKSEPAASDTGDSVQRDHHMEIIEGEEHTVYRVRESQDEGQSEVVYKRKKNKWKPLQVVDTTEDRYRRAVDDSDDDDDDESSDEDDDSIGNIYQDNDEDQMITLLKNDWKTYKRCIITIEGSQKMFARNLDRNDKLHTINISSRLRCNRAFDGDEVVVKVVSSSDRKSDLPQGEVVGILRKAMKVRLCICRVDPFNPCLLIPLNRGIPKMNNLIRDKERHAAGTVAIYTKTKHGGIQIKRYEPIDHTNPSSKLFLVRFLKWDAKFYSPLGIAVDVIPAPTGIEDGEAVLKLEYNLREKYQMRTEAEIDDLYKEDFCLSDQELVGRSDYTEDLTFTIDPPGSGDLDDALSVKKTQQGWLIGIHIADVSHFVPQDSHIDREARVRCLTFYQPRNPPVAMLPPRLSSDLCSLQPWKIRLAVSVLLHVDDHDYNLIAPVEVTQSVVCSKLQLTYKEAQQILENQNIRTYPKDLVDSLTFLDKVAKKWRYKRLGDSSHALQPDQADCLDAHRLVEEMMVRVNHETARKLLEAVNDTVPLRIQQRPNEESLHEWCAAHHEYAQQSLSLQRALSEVQLQRPCQCIGRCNCLTKFRTNPQVPVSITHQLLSCLKAALDKKDDRALRNLIATSMLTPEMAVAEFAYRDIQERAEYKCSGDTETAYHASLNLEPYLHFTSPIRRYVDIVAHRLIKAVTEDTSPTYKRSDIRRVCDQCNSATLKQKRYDKEVQSLKLNVMMKEQPLVVYPVVEKVEDGRICLRFPTMSNIPFTVGALSYSHLDLQTLPIYDAQRQEVELYWEEQVYDYSRYRKDSDFTASSGAKEIKLDPYRFVTQIPAVEWQQLISRIKADDSSGLRKKVHELLMSTSRKKTNLSAGKHCEASIKLKLKVSRAQVHRVQLTSRLTQGRLTPRIQLFTLSDNLDICIEHHQDPLTCFAKTTGLRVTRDYACAKDYRERWVPVLKAEAACQAITHGESFFLKGVNIKWKRTEDGAIEGKLSLLTDFCEEDQAFDVGGGTCGEEQYLCVQYQGIAVSEKVLGADIVKAAQAEDKVSLVAHCLVTAWNVDEPKKDRTTTINMVVHQSSMPFPDLPRLADQKATIEAIAEPLPMKRMLVALNGFKKEGMAEYLALGRKPPKLDEEKVKRAHKESKSIPGMVEANSGQQHAVVKALNQSFSVIHGPPGTGKTVTGVRIAFMFAKLNQVENEQNKVLYCGPSNKSVEVVIDYLKGTKKKAYLELVRVYGEDVVQLQYPLPTKYKPPRRLQSSSERENLVQECRHPDIALHKLIRDASHCPEQAGKIRGYDNAFRKEIERMSQNPNRFKGTKEENATWRREVARYKKLVSEASTHILLRADIVLVTCTGSASPIISQSLGSKINQVIIDEAGMCMEPEALVPLTSCDPKQVVLIGDHQQLQPIVQSEMGQRLGLKRSLFARYVKVADMLTTQYRMHEAIAKLPSELFYDDRLTCGNPEQQLPSMHKGMWPGGTSCPIAFVDIRGEEMSQVITTADGNEQSKYNPEEAKYTANVVRALIMDRRIRPDCIQVLSQYRAHCKEIREQFDRLNFNARCDVTTVTKSQGSEVDYIVLSAVRSLPSEMIEMRPTHGWLKRCLGTISDPHQVNVAITRARKGLIIIGNRELLSASEVWRQLFDHYRRHKAIATSPHEFLRNIRMGP